VVFVHLDRYGVWVGSDVVRNGIIGSALVIVFVVLIHFYTKGR